MMSADRVEWHLWNFARWQWVARESGEGYPSRASGHIENYRSQNYSDSERNWDQVCKRLADATDAAVNDLTPVFKTAIYAKCLEGPWPMPEAALALVYRAALPMVGRGLNRRGIE